MRALALVLVLLSMLAPSPTRAWPLHATGISAACPQGSGLGDGCPQNIGGTFRAVASAGLWGPYARASGQTWAGGNHPWVFNAPAIDYAVANYTPTAQLLDPTTAPLPTGCHLTTGGISGGFMVECYSVTDLTISGYDFGLHNCIPLQIDRSVSGILVISNNRFKNGSNCSQLHATVKGHFDAAKPTQFTVDSVISGAIQSGDTLQGANIGPGTFTVSGTSSPYPVTGGDSRNGECKDATACLTTSMTYYIGKAMQYPVDIVYNNQSITAVTFSNNLFDGDGVNNPMSIGFFVYVGVGTNNNATPVTFTYNAFIHIPARVVSMASNGTEIFKYNYFEDFCYSFADDHCEINLNILRSGQSMTQTWSYNVVLQGKTNPIAGGTALVWLGPGWDVTSTWTQTQFDHNIEVANCVTNGPGNEGDNPGASACTGGASGLSNVVQSAMAEAQDGTYVNINFASNYVDAYGGLFTSAILNGKVSYPTTWDTQCTNPAVWSGNVNLVSGAAITGWTSDSTGSC